MKTPLAFALLLAFSILPSAPSWASCATNCAELHADASRLLNLLDESRSKRDCVAKNVKANFEKICRHKKLVQECSLGSVCESGHSRMAKSACMFPDAAELYRDAQCTGRVILK